MKRKYDSRLFQESIISEINKIEKELDFPNIFYDAVKKGKIARKQFQKLEYKKFDEDWISNLESFFPSLDKITRNLRSSLRYETEILPIEKTRRTNPESIRHLIQNTRYIREVVDEDGIIPEKVLNSLSEIEYGIYENRFIMTLVCRINDYLSNRLKTIKEHMHGFKETNFDLSNEFHLNNANYELNVSLKALEEMDSKEIDEHNHRVYERVEEAYKIVSRMYHSEFMRIMLRYKKVKAPIMKTQIILKNPDFRNAYLLWLYLDRIHVLDYTLESEIRNKRFNRDYHLQLDQGILFLFSVIFNNSNLGSANTSDEKLISRSIKPKDEREDYVSDALMDIPYLDMEPQQATEYYLKKAKQIFGKQFDEISKFNSNEKHNLKQILLDQYSIIDQIYEHYFNSNQDEDVFNRLINANDPVKKFNDAEHKYIITKMAREVKERLYNDALVLEKKWVKEVETYQKEAIETLKDRGLKETNDEIKKISKVIDKDLSKIEKELNAKNRRTLQARKRQVDAQITKIKKKHQEELKKFKEKEALRLVKEKAKLKEKQQKDKEKLKLKKQKELQKNRELLLKKKDLEQRKQNEKLKKQKDLITKKTNQKL